MRGPGFIAIVFIAFAGCSFDGSGPGWNADGSESPDATAIGGDGATSVDGNWDDHADAASAADAVLDIDGAPVTCIVAACPLGCNLALDRCNRLDPTNFDVPGFYDELGSAISAGYGEDVHVDTDTGEIAGGTTYRPGGDQGETVSGIYFDLVTQPDGPVLAVFAMTALDLPDGAQLIVSGTHPAAFFATGNITLAGEVEAYGWYEAAGPGGGRGATSSGADGASCNGGQGRGGAQAGSGDWQIEAGGGGGGLAAAGGNGANAQYGTSSAAGGAGGIVLSATSPVSPLRGGCGGGAGGGPDTAGNEPNDGGTGGGGGGGIQFSAQGTLTVTVTGVIDVGGGQAQGGQHGAGGGGGGSGGAILLEAAIVSVQGIVVANGGGAGAGAPDTGSNGQNGEYARQSALPALGGVGSNYGGSGGNGGAAAVYAGGDGTVDANGGGGGGSVGVMGLRYHASVATTGTLSPDNYSSQSGLAVW